MGSALDRGCFTGDGAQHLVAFDPANGDVLRHAGFADDLGNGPETYLLDGHQYLVAIEQVSLGAVTEIVGEAGMPEDVTICGIECDQVLRAVAGEATSV